MQFKNIHIEGFRGISSLAIDDFKKINLFVGKNNCGKTSVLEALFLLVGISNPQLAVNINRFRDFIHEADDHNFRLIFKNLDFDKPIHLTAAFDKNEAECRPYERSLTIKPHFKKSTQVDSKTVSKSELNFDSDNVSTYTQPVANGLVAEFQIKEKHSPRESFTSSIITLSGGGAELSQPGNYVEEINAVFVSPRTIYQSLDIRLDKLLVEKQEEKIVAILQKIDSKIKDISLGANGIIYCDIGLNRLVPINIMGDGIRRLLSVIAIMADVKNGIILIDEIENGFHYSALETLWDAVIETAHQYNVQVFATTHSEDCISALNAAYRNTIDLFENDAVRLYRIEKNENVHRAVAYNQEVLETSLELNLGIR